MSLDSTHYFRIEAKELLAGLVAGVLELEEGRAGDLPRLRRLAHTLKGAARVVGEGAVGERVHAFEEALGAAGSAEGPVPSARFRDLLAQLDGISEGIFGAAGLDPVAPARRPRASEPVDTVRIELKEMDGLLEAITVVGTSLTGFRRPIEELDAIHRLVASLEAEVRTQPTRAWSRAELQAHVRLVLDQLSGMVGRCRNDLLDAKDRSEAELLVLYDRAQGMRLLPAGLVFAGLERAARDAAHALGKRVSFVTVGEDVRIGSHVLDVLREALLHVIRNAVAHGIEAPEARVAAGKTAEGHVRLTVERGPDGITVSCSDDGAGLDLAAIGRAAARRGLLDAADIPTLTLERAVAILGAGGVSTRDSADLLAGRGVGLNAVGAAVERANGRWSVRSERGVGTTIEIRVPPSLTSLLALEVRAAGRDRWIPSYAVLRTAHVEPAALVRAEGYAAIVDDGAAIPVVSLTSLLTPDAPVMLDAGGPVVIVAADGARVALLVDALVGLRTILMHPLPEGLGAVPLVCGTTLDAEGHPELVLDPAGLVRARTASPAPTARPAPGRPLLVVDDSLTTRLLEQSILQTAGFEVDLAVSAEDALVQVRQRDYALILVDVEMPGMDGFAFVTAVRADPALARTPCILVTSRNAAADAARGQEVGAAGYIVKGDFDQTTFLALVRRLVS